MTTIEASFSRGVCSIVSPLDQQAITIANVFRQMIFFRIL